MVNDYMSNTDLSNIATKVDALSTALNKLPKLRAGWELLETIPFVIQSDNDSLTPNYVYDINYDKELTLPTDSVIKWVFETTPEFKTTGPYGEIRLQSVANSSYVFPERHSRPIRGEIPTELITFSNMALLHIYISGSVTQNCSLTLKIYAKSIERTSAPATYEYPTDLSEAKKYTDASCEAIDSKLSGYVPTTRTVNGLKLSGNISLTRQHLWKSANLSATSMGVSGNGYLYTVSTAATSYKLILPSSTVTGWCARLRFTTGGSDGGTITFTCASTIVRWYGDDVSAGVFTPAVKSTYCIRFDGYGTYIIATVYKV